MKKHLLMPAAALVLLAGCQYNKDNFEGLEDSTQPTDVMNISYTLTNADYGTISDNTTNQAIAKKAGVDKALGYVKTDFFLSQDIPAATYIPAFLAGKYYTADPGSSVKITYNYREDKSELLTAYSSAKIFQPSNDDYKAIYGASEFASYLNNANSQLPTLLSNKYKEPKDGDVIFVDYKSATGTNNVLKDPLLWQNFEGMATGDLSSFKDWLNKGNWFVSSTGGPQWKVVSFDENQYVQYSANGAKGACEAWMISPAIEVGTSDYFSFDLKVGYWNANCLSVFISKNFDGSNPDNAIWENVTNKFNIPEAPTNGYASSFASVGSVSLASYSGEKVYIAFKYVGNGDKNNAKSTTYQIDNIMIGSTLPIGGGFSSLPTYVVRVYNAKDEVWNKPNSKVRVLEYSDYVAMGQSKAYFTADVLAANYIPTYLAKQVAYPLDGETRVVMYRYYNGKEVKIYSDEYVYSSETNRWALNSRVVQKTDQFVYSAEGKWNFDPSTTVTLKSKEQAVKTFYQTIVDWVKANKGAEYIGSKLDSEYFFGSSAYNCNFDFRPSAWKAQNAAAYGNMSDADLKALMMTRLPEAFLPGLEVTYPNAAPVEGVNVIYTVNFSIYDGSVTNSWTIKYEVKEKGKFTYVENSLAEVK